MVKELNFLPKGNRELRSLSRFEFVKGLSGCWVRNGLNGKLETSGEKHRETIADNQAKKGNGLVRGRGSEEGRRLEGFRKSSGRA